MCKINDYVGDILVCGLTVDKLLQQRTVRAKNPGTQMVLISKIVSTKYDTRHCEIGYTVNFFVSDLKQ